MSDEKVYRIAQLLGEKAYVSATVTSDKAVFECSNCEGPICAHISAVKQAVKTGDLPENYKWYSGALMLTSPGSRLWAAIGIALYRIQHRAESGKWPARLVVPIPSHLKKNPPEPAVAAVLPMLPEPMLPEPKKLTDSDLVKQAMLTGNAAIELD